MQVYESDKVWRQLQREGMGVTRCTMERLMRRPDLRGVLRRKVVRTTVGDPAVPCPLDRITERRTGAASARLGRCAAMRLRSA